MWRIADSGRMQSVAQACHNETRRSKKRFGIKTMRFTVKRVLSASYLVYDMTLGFRQSD